MSKAASPSWFRVIELVVWGLTALLGLWWLLSVSGSAAQMNTLNAQGWPQQMADVIVSQKTKAVGYAFLMSLALSSFLFALKKEVPRKPLVVALLAVLAVDALLIANHYISKVPASYYQENEIIRILKDRQGYQRLALASQSGFYNTWLTYLLPHHNITTYNFTQMPRMPEDYSQFLQTVGRNPVRMWRLGAVSYVLGPAQMVRQLSAMPEVKGQVEVAYAFNVGQDNRGELMVVPASQSQPPQHALVYLKNAAPRFALIGAWRSLPDEETLQTLADPGYEILNEVFIAEESTNDLLVLAQQGPAGSVKVLSYKSGNVELEVDAERPAILRFAERYDRNWKATVDGEAVPLLRGDYIFQGVYVEAGKHMVKLVYSPPMKTLWLQIAGMIIVVLALLALPFCRKKVKP